MKIALKKSSAIRVVILFDITVTQSWRILMYKLALDLDFAVMNLIHSFKKYSLSTYFVPVIVLNIIHSMNKKQTGVKG